ncbi:WD40-repeat-containing domain protein [Mrakia frigida]|uniref:WD40-repeat-containing domain protein n=1 Tax=Mrakia frigida TaxID=29902 RepID=UPI003FCC0CBB
MKLIKPNWVVHEDGKDKGRKMPIYTIHVHPDGSRLATGGLDAKIRIWSTLPILLPEVEANEANPRLLCTMGQHDGSVLCVRWAHHGRYLASGSDDKVVVIWDLDPRGGGRTFGSADINVETWKPLQRLVGHSSDVVDLAWSRDDTKIATVGLDSMVFVWDASTFNMITKIGLHEGFVKGVCWDPVGEYLATQSDDKSVKIWRTTDWTLAKTVTEPFNNSPGSTFFRRLSWSPDGAFIASSNAMNHAVFTAAIIQRHEWKQDISFVGHENTVEVTAFNPRIFHASGKTPTRGKASCIVALGSDDRSISIWLNVQKAPLLVVKEVFDGTIFDLSWTDQGRTLYGCSSDGTIVALDFEEEEIKGFADEGCLETILETYPFYSSRPQAAPRAMALPPAPTITVNQLVPRSSASVSSNPLVASKPVPLPAPTPQIISISSKNGKKRIQPSFINEQGQAGSFPTASMGGAFAGAGTAGVTPTSSMGGHMGQNGASGSEAPSLSAILSRPLHPTGGVNELQTRRIIPQDVSRAAQPSPRRIWEEDVQMHNSRDQAVDQPGWDAERSTAHPSENALGKRKAEDEYASRVQSRTLGGGGYQRPMVDDRELRATFMAGGAQMYGSGLGGMAVPPVRSYIKALSEESGDWVEATNDLSAPIEISHHSGATTEWLDYLPSPVIALVITSLYSAFGCEDGSLSVYSPTGRKILPTMMLDGPCSFMQANARGGLSVVTAVGTLCEWNIKSKTALHPFSSPNISTILRPLSPNSPPPQIIQSSFRPTHAHLFLLSNGTAYTFSSRLSSWLIISSKWFAHGSIFWEKRPPTSATRGIVAQVDAVLDEQSDGRGFLPTSPWWEKAMSLGHLEGRMLACLELGAMSGEYRGYLNAYAKRLGDEGFRAKAEELVKDLAGPMGLQFPGLIYGRSPPSSSISSLTILGVSRRDLLKDVLSLFVRSKTLGKLGQDWLDVLRQVAAVEREAEEV